jgi:hypothetical protein
MDEGAELTSAAPGSFIFIDDGAPFRYKTDFVASRSTMMEATPWPTQ